MKLSAPIYLLKRKAKRIAHEEGLPLHAALDRVARDEGFQTWSLLASRFSSVTVPNGMLPRLTGGDLLLLGARPGHGKTLLGLELLLEAARAGRRAVFFTLEYTEQDVLLRIGRLEKGAPCSGHGVDIVTSDEICADYVIRYLSGMPCGTVAVIDYLQILDQRRDTPHLSEQIIALQAFARQTGMILAFISQIHRSYDPAAKPVPDIEDLRLPNRVELGHFSKACFLHAGQMRFQALR